MSRALELEEGVALGSGAWYSDTGVDPQSFTLYVAPKPGVDLAEAEARMDALLARFVAEGPDPEQLERVQRSTSLTVRIRGLARSAVR